MSLCSFPMCNEHEVGKYEKEIPFCDEHLKMAVLFGMLYKFERDKK